MKKIELESIQYNSGGGVMWTVRREKGQIIIEIEDWAERIILPDTGEDLQTVADNFSFDDLS